MSEWRPIETAPKDGTIVLAYEPSGSSEFVCIAWMDVGQWAGWIYADDVLAEMAEPEATHWMPLPPPPARERGKP